MTQIPYYFLWSQNYKIFADILKKGLSYYNDIFEDRSLFIEQSIFDKNMYKAEGHHFNGCFFKLQKTYDLLHTLPEGSYFVMSDADVILFPGKHLRELFELYIKMNADLVFMRDAPRLNISNVGFILLRVSQVNRDLYKKVMEDCEKNPTGLDQSIVNNLLKTYSGSHFYFPHELVATTCTLKECDVENKERIQVMRSNCMVFQALCDGGATKEQVFNQKIMQYKILGVPIN
jgi:hypothetical protein